MEVKKIKNKLKRIIKFPKEYSYEELIKTEMNFPIVIKTLNVLHKTEKKAVSIVFNKKDFFKEYKRIRKINKELIIQEYIKGIEFFLSVKKDENFGYFILFGIGGVFVELYKDVSIKLLPLKKKDIEDMFRELKGNKILYDYRNQKINLNKLKKIIMSFSKFAIKYNAKEIEINPLIATEEEFYCVDLKINN